MTTGSPTPSPSISKLTIQLNLASVTPSPSLAVAMASASETDDDSDVVDISLCSNKSNPAHSFGIHGLQNAVYDYTHHPTFLGGAEADDDLEGERESIGLAQSQDRHDSDKESSIEGSSQASSQLYIEPKEEFYTSSPCKDAPELICAWIMNECDSIKLDSTLRPKSEIRSGYQHAQKQCASATFGFGQIYRLGNLPWHESDSKPGHMVGNPSVSQQVSLYMVSLRHRKVKNGEEPMSAHAITPDIIGHMYDFNRKSENFDIKPVIAQKRNKDDKNPDQ
ncbi:hypothetical protein WG66_003324 [Moniliophthora roreri]|nr:hypothetical protein WG66_003324 [Moniliophthora roreri]